MYKFIVGLTLILILPFFTQVAIASEPAPLTPENYCKDKNSWEAWNVLSKKYPNDLDVQTLHALRIGLCIKIEKGSITLKKAITFLIEFIN